MVSSVMLIGSGHSDTLTNDIRKSLVSRLEKEQVKVHLIASVDDIERTLSAFPHMGVAVVDVPSAQDKSWEVLEKVRDFHPKLKLIVVTARKDNEFVLKAMKLGVLSLFTQPLDGANETALLASVQRGLKESEAERYRRDLLIELQARVQRAEGREEDRFWFVSKSKAMEPVNEWLTVLRRESMKGSPEPSVLISGEIGAGEEGIARMIYAASRRGRKSWLVLRCGALPGDLLEAELFGYEKGSFQGALTQKKGALEIANGGTVFLMDIDSATSAFQAKLNQFLQNSSFRRLGGTEELRSDVRIIASSSTSLKNVVHSGKFREDLYRRLSQMSITIPALRERSEDILPMAIHFSRQIFKTHNRNFNGFTPEAEKALVGYSWPGNVHELYSVLNRTALICKSNGMVSVSELGLGGVASGSSSLGASSEGQSSVPNLEEGLNYTALKKKWCDSFEMEFLKVSLRRNAGNVSAAAREAKLDRSNFLRLLRRHGLKAESYRRISHLPPVAGPAGGPSSGGVDSEAA